MTLNSQVKVEPWDHQTDAFNFLRNRPHGALFSSMGTGKSLVALGLIGEWNSPRNLIICPTSMVPVWEREINNMAGFPVKAIPLTGKLSDRAKILHDTAFERGPQRIYIINYEAMVYRKMADALEWADFNTVVLDESHRIKTPSSQTTKATLRISRSAVHKLIMTGTPAADKPTDIFMQLRFLSGQILGGSYGPFFEKYVIYRLASTSAGARYKEIQGYKNLDELGKIIDRHSFRVSSDVLNLIPALPPMKIPVKLGDKARSLYNRMLRDSIVEFEKGEVAATNVLTRMLRLQEITSGYLRTDAEPLQPLRETKIIDNAKLDAVEDLIDAFDPLEPVVIFHQFKVDSTRIAARVDKMGRKIYMLNGQRNELETWKKNAGHGAVLAVQLRAGSVGISMIEASKVIYYSHSFSLATFEQSAARVHRPGQTRQVSYYHLMAPGTIDEALLNALESKRVTANGLLESVRALKG